ncbi:MAG: HNH endonuclease [bacterium]|nr:HNH endonuclease [bacterium]
MSGPPTPEFQLKFLDYIQRVLDEGGFVATYKFALLMALADLSVEKGDESGNALELPVDWIAQKFIQYYARQTVPYPAAGGERVLHQNTSKKQAKIVNLVAEAQAPYFASGKPVPLHRLSDSRNLVRQVVRTVKDQPLWRLQVINGPNRGFLYPEDRQRDEVTLNPGIAYCFRRFHGFVIRMAQEGWTRQVREIGKNRDLLGAHADLAVFLFGTSRTPLAEYRSILEEVQGRACFYCDTQRRETEVDHFIPWSWYSLDLGHNFVLACKSCNAAKRDRLAALRHLERWARRNGDLGASMAAAFRERQLPSDLTATTTVASWAYRRAETVGGDTWVIGNEYEPLLGGWPRVLAI